STILPLPSSPHWLPTTTTFAMKSCPRPESASRRARRPAWSHSFAAYRQKMLEGRRALDDKRPDDKSADGRGCESLRRPHAPTLPDPGSHQPLLGREPRGRQARRGQYRPLHADDPALGWRAAAGPALRHRPAQADLADHRPALAALS